MQNKGNHSIKRYRTYIGMHSPGRTLGLKKRFGGLYRTYYALFMHYLRKRPKAGTGKDQGGSGQNKHRKMERGG